MEIWPERRPETRKRTADAADLRRASSSTTGVNALRGRLKTSFAAEQSRVNCEKSTGHRHNVEFFCSQRGPECPGYSWRKNTSSPKINSRRSGRTKVRKSSAENREFSEKSAFFLFSNGEEKLQKIPNPNLLNNSRDLAIAFHQRSIFYLKNKY